MSKHLRTLAAPILGALVAIGGIGPSPSRVMAHSAPAALSNSPAVLGNSIGEWSAKWWKWALAIPQPSNPLTDPTGASCAVGQRGPVWFLAGVFGNGTVVRSCTIPAGKHILLPIANAIWIQTPLDDPSNTEETYRELAEFFLPTTGGDLEATVDGRPVVFDPATPIVRTQSPVFRAHFPADNIFAFDPFYLTGYPIVSDGFWVMLPPLRRGEHVLKFKAGANQDVTYMLTVSR